MRLPPPSLQPPLQRLLSFPSHFTAGCLFVFIMCFTSLLPAVVFAWVAESGGKGKRAAMLWGLSGCCPKRGHGVRLPQNIGWPTWCFLFRLRPIFPIAMATQKLSFPGSWAPRLSALTRHQRVPWLGHGAGHPWVRS